MEAFAFKVKLRLALVELQIGAFSHNVMVQCKNQWKPFWLATQLIMTALGGYFMSLNGFTEAPL